MPEDGPGHDCKSVIPVDIVDGFPVDDIVNDMEMPHAEATMVFSHEGKDCIDHGSWMDDVGDPRIDVGCMKMTSEKR